MKKAILTGAIVGIVVLALGAAGLAYAQTQNPMDAYFQEDTGDAYPYGPGMRGRGGFNGGMMGQGIAVDGEGLLHDYMSTALADAFGLSVEDLEALHESGETLWDYAQEQGITQEDFFSLMQSARTEALNQAVADEVITQEQADWMLSHMGGAAGFGTGTGECHRELGSGDFGYGMRGSRGGWNSQP
jgi:hypothetical protein